MIGALNDDDSTVVLDPAALVRDPRIAAEIRVRSPISLRAAMQVTGSCRGFRSPTSIRP
jgi:hypothetical protein